MPIAPVELSNGEIVNIEYIATGPQQKSFLGKKYLSTFLTKLSGTVEDIRKSVEGASPNKLTIELGIDVGIEEGELTAIFIKGSGNANFKVTLEWERKE